MSYNAIVVGDYNRYNDIICPGSSYYSGSLHAYKPDICAPAYLVLTFPNESSGTYYTNGTSNATAITTGVIALIMSLRGHLREQPATVKAIVTAGVSLSTAHHYVPSDTNYRRYGAGVLNAKRADEITSYLNYISGEIYQTTTTISHQISLADTTTTRISLASLKIVNEILDYTSPALELNIYDAEGNLVAQSSTIVNNLEIVEFVPEEAGTYTVVIRKIVLTTTTNYAISWIQ